MAPALDPYEDKLRQMLAKGALSPDQLAHGMLDGQDLLELCGFTIDLELTEKQRLSLLANLGVQASKKAEVGRSLQAALETAIPDEVQDFMINLKIDEAKLRSGLIATATAESAEDLLNLALENNRCGFEVYSSITDDNIFKRNKRLYDKHKQARSAAELWNATAATLPLIDQLVVLVLMDLPKDKMQRLAHGLSLTPDAFQQAAPRVLATQITKTDALAATLPSVLGSFSKDALLELLLAREQARSVWFQTVGPNVTATFCGVLDKSVPGYVSDPDQPVLELPDFHMAIYENGIVKAQHLGIDGLLSTDFEIRTIAHTYRGTITDTTIQLNEGSIFAPNPKRPTLGDLTFKDFKIDASGLTARLNWRDKTVTLKWDPGF